MRAARHDSLQNTSMTLARNTNLIGMIMHDQPRKMTL